MRKKDRNILSTEIEWERNKQEDWTKKRKWEITKETFTNVTE